MTSTIKYLHRLLAFKTERRKLMWGKNIHSHWRSLFNAPRALAAQIWLMGLIKLCFNPNQRRYEEGRDEKVLGASLVDSRDGARSVSRGVEWSVEQPLYSLVRSRSLPASTHGRVDVNVHNMQPHWTRLALLTFTSARVALFTSATIHILRSVKTWVTYMVMLQYK